jgi:hypothetical protein
MEITTIFDPRSLIKIKISGSVRGMGTSNGSRPVSARIVGPILFLPLLLAPCGSGRVHSRQAPAAMLVGLGDTGTMLSSMWTASE